MQEKRFKPSVTVIKIVVWIRIKKWTVRDFQARGRSKTWIDGG